MIIKSKLCIAACSCLFLGLVLLFPFSSYAQDNQEPSLPPTLQTLLDQGAQIRYLGNSYGLDGWVTIKGGQEQYFYSHPRHDGVVMGLMFDEGGKMETLRQVNELRQKEGDVLDFFAVPEEKNDPISSVSQTMGEYKSPAEQLYSDIESSNWVALGKSDAPFIYTFIDPQCPHCHKFIEILKQNYLQNGLLQVRMIPVGFRNDTLSQAAFLLAAPDPQERWYRHLEGDETALPITKSVNQQGVQRNKAIMQSWKLDVTPLSVYKTAAGEIKIVQGGVKDIAALLADLEQPRDN